MSSETPSPQRSGTHAAQDPGACPGPGPCGQHQGDSEADWSQRRRHAASERARLLQERQDAEHARAARVVDAFTRLARREGLAAVPLRVHGYGGERARTGLRGWYLRSDESVAIDVEGCFYVLVQSLSLRERLLGAAPSASPVPMTIGEGGRDGDVMPLRTALNRLLPGWEERCQEPLV